MWVFVILMGMVVFGVMFWDMGFEFDDEGDEMFEDEGLIIDQIIPGFDIVDYFEGGVGNDQFNGYGGVDILVGNDGDDVLIGQDDEDEFIGGCGED